jgi:hypothetical protein
MKISINRLILDKLKERDIPDHVKCLIRDILQHERRNMELKSRNYTRKYEILLNQYVLHEQENESK